MARALQEADPVDALVEVDGQTGEALRPGLRGRAEPGAGRWVGDVAAGRAVDRDVVGGGARGAGP
ncbi:hypothetical protein, partial [Kitasatospora sp. NPDC007106]|uniref:hypothetical protein n=1 Tax=Kitasatospora sp. NPDC007106 TaxID=3156914 RepID=UPI0033D003D9